MLNLQKKELKSNALPIASDFFPVASLRRNHPRSKMSKVVNAPFTAKVKATKVTRVGKFWHAVLFQLSACIAGPTG